MKEIDPLRPAKAAFYSAVLPGLGQVYNKRYWKLPLIYGGIGASIYYYDLNTKILNGIEMPTNGGWLASLMMNFKMSFLTMIA